MCTCMYMYIHIVHPEGNSIDAYAMRERERTLTACADLIQRTILVLARVDPAQRMLNCARTCALSADLAR